MCGHGLFFWSPFLLPSAPKSWQGGDLWSRGEGTEVLLAKRTPPLPPYSWWRPWPWSEKGVLVQDVWVGLASVSGDGARNNGHHHSQGLWSFSEGWWWCPREAEGPEACRAGRGKGSPVSRKVGLMCEASGCVWVHLRWWSKLSSQCLECLREHSSDQALWEVSCTGAEVRVSAFKFLTSEVDVVRHQI